MSKKLEPCPFCGGEARIIVCDDEGNHHSDDYEDDPWSGLGFMLYQDEENNPECPIAHDVEGQCGRANYDTREEAIAAWNRCAETEANLPLTLEVLRPVQLCQMEDQEVWMKRMGCDEPAELATVKKNGHCVSQSGCLGYRELYGETWIAYRRPPEGGEG